jgi:hypothetical protein
MRTKLRSKFTLLFMTFALLLAIPAVALADNVQNNVVAGGNDTITAGDTTTVNYRIAANNGDGQTGCNASDTTAATVTINAPAGVTATPGSLSFSSCGTDKSVVFSSSTVGDHVITVSVSDSGVGTYSTTPARFTLHVNAAPPPSDTTPPVITPTVAGTLGENSWYTSNVNVSWLVEDGESDISSTSGCGPTTISTDTAGTTLTCTATSAGGQSSDSVTIKRDATAPSSVSGTLARVADHNGWYTAPVGYQFSGKDATSGIASCSSGTYSGPDGTGLTVSGSCADNAGNSANGSSPAFKYDATAPVVQANADRSADHNGWYNAPFTVSFSGTDATSGNVSCDPAVNYNGPDTTADSISGSCADEAGNSAQATFNFKYDNTDPSVSGTLARAADHNGWYNAPVGYSFSGTDATSGIDNSSCSSGTYSGPDGTGLTVSGSCADNAGNSANGSSPAFKYDATKPTNVHFIGGPAAGSSHYFGSVPAAPTCDADDATSELQSPNGCVVSDYSNAVGSHTMTATATDNAGNVETATRTYTVLAWTFNGFYQPVDMNGVYNSVKGGQTVPLKFELFAGPTELTATSDIKSLTYTKVTCTSSAPIDAIEETVATGGTSLRYDSTGGQFIYNWKTPTGAACYKVTLTAQDGSTLIAYFKSLK